ncbi:HU family DNA-binding protein [Shewanella psychrophila]|nr:HU family DNA-binding protein [Shewanella psychrophila]
MTKTKKDLVVRVKQDIPKYQANQLKEMTDFLLNDIVEIAKSGYVVSLKNLGNIQQIHKAARPGRNPKTGEDVLIAARSRISFKFRPSLAQIQEET